METRRRQGGDPARMRLTRQRDRLLGRIQFMMGSRARRVTEPEDVLQGVFVKALGRLGDRDDRDEGDLLRWMTAMARNHIRDTVRRRREEAIESLSASGFRSIESVEDPSTPASQAELGDEVARLLEAFGRLEPRYQEVIVMRSLEGLRFREVGERCGRTEGAARLLHIRAMVALGASLRRRG